MSVSNHFAKARLAVLGFQDEVPTTSKNLEIYDHKEDHSLILVLIGKQEHLWYG